jgi:hypothetical protein
MYFWNMNFGVSFYNSVNIKYKSPDFATEEYQFYNLCPLHNSPLAQGPILDNYLRFNTLCYTCPKCPEVYSLHFHSERKACKSPMCEPLRLVYRGENRPIHRTRFHNCYHHFQNNRIPIGPLGNIILPHHAYSPHFPTKKSFFDAGDLFWCASAEKPSPHRPLAMDEMEAEQFACFQILYESEHK